MAKRPDPDAPKRPRGRPPGTTGKGGRSANPDRDALYREQTRLAKVKADEAEGHVANVADIQAAWAGLVLETRSALLAVPSRVGARLGDLTPAHLAVIRDEIIAALEALSRGESSP